MTIPAIPTRNPVVQRDRAIINRFLIQPDVIVLGAWDDGTGFRVRFRAAAVAPWVQVHVQTVASGGLPYDPDNSLSSTEVDCRANLVQEVTISDVEGIQFVVYLIPIQKDAAGAVVLYDGEGGRPNHMSVVSEIWSGQSNEMLNVRDWGAVGDGVTDDEPAIQAALDYAAASPHTQNKTIYFPPGDYAVGKPLRVKTKGMTLLGCVPAVGGKTSIFGTSSTHGPLLCLYPDRDTNGAPGSQYYPVSINLEPALLTGDGSAFDIAKYNNAGGYPPPSGKTDDNERYFLFRPDCILTELNGRGLFCAEATIKVRPISLSPFPTGAILTSAGKCWGFSENARDECFGLTLEGAPRKLRGWITVGGVKSRVLESTTTIVDDAQYHIALDYDGAKLRLFLDGVMEDSEPLTGTLTQRHWEHVSLGQTWDEYPEMQGGGYSAAPVIVDGVRLSSNTRYGSDTSFTPPTAKWPSPIDHHTLVALNFHENFDSLTTALALDSRAVYLMLRRPANFPQGGILRLENLHLYGWFGAFRAGIWGVNIPQSRFRDLEVVCYCYAGYFWHDVYLSVFENIRFSAFTRNGAAVVSAVVCAFPAASGLTTFLGADFTGGSFQLVSQGGLAVFNAFFNCSSDTIASTVCASSGEGQLYLAHCAVSREVSGPDAVAAHIVGAGGRLNLLAGSAEHFNGEPAILNQQGRVVAIAWNSHSAPDDATKPYVMVVKAGNNDFMPSSSVFVGCQRWLFQSNAAIQDRWTDQPRHAGFLDGKRLKPSATGGEVIQQSGGGTVTLDCSHSSKFVIQVNDTTAFTIASPTYVRSGQQVSIMVQNWSGGAMGIITWGVAFHMASFTNPANRYQRSVVFEGCGSLGMNEVSRTMADAPVPDYTPSDFAGLAAHWKADALGLADTDPVAAWADETAENNDLAQADVARRPIYLDNQVNGLPAVLFDGLQTYLATAGNASAGFTGIRTDRTIFILARSDSEPTPGVASHGLLDWGAFYRLFRQYTKSWQEGFSDGTSFQNTDSGGATWPVSAWVLVVVRRDSGEGSIKLWMDGVFKAQSAWDPVQAGNGIIEMGRVGSSDVNVLDGAIAEIAVYAAALTEDERQAIEQYFARKYDLDIGVIFE